MVIKYAKRWFFFTFFPKDLPAAGVTYVWQTTQIKMFQTGRLCTRTKVVKEAETRWLDMKFKFVSQGQVKFKWYLQEQFKVQKFLFYLVIYKVSNKHLNNSLLSRKYHFIEMSFPLHEHPIEFFLFHCICLC